jgi:hypothetical protein
MGLGVRRDDGGEDGAPHPLFLNPAEIPLIVS